MSGPSAWAPAATWETEKKLQAPGFEQPSSVHCLHFGSELAMEDFSLLSLLLFKSAFQIKMNKSAKKKKKLPFKYLKKR